MSVSLIIYKMSKLCGGGDTPFVTFKCVFVNSSSNVEVVTDRIDGENNEGEDDEYEYKIRRFCCIQWMTKKLRRAQNENTLENPHPESG
jgi:hypothetical protein